MAIQSIMSGIDRAASYSLLGKNSRERVEFEHRMRLERISAYIDGVIAAAEGVIADAVVSDAIQYAKIRSEEVIAKLEELTRTKNG